MRLIQQKSWTHPSIQSTTTASTTQYTWPTSTIARHSPTPAHVPTNPERTRPIARPYPSAQFGSQESVRSVPKTQVTAAQMAFRSTQPTLEPEHSVQANNIRR